MGKLQPDEVKWGSIVFSILENTLGRSKGYEFPVVPIQCLFIGIMDSDRKKDGGIVSIRDLKSIYDTIVWQINSKHDEISRLAISTEVEGWSNEVVSVLQYARIVALERGARYVDQFDLLVSMLRGSSSCSWPLLANAGVRERDIKSRQATFYQESRPEDRDFPVKVSPEILYLAQSGSDITISRQRKRELMMLNAKFTPSRAVAYNAMWEFALFAAIGLLSNFVTHLGLIPSLTGGVIVWAAPEVARILLGFARFRRAKQRILSRLHE